MFNVKIRQGICSRVSVMLLLRMGQNGFSRYKQCCYCRNILKKDFFKGVLCKECSSKYNKKHRENKRGSGLSKYDKHLCQCCSVPKRCTAFSRNQNKDNLICRCCVSNSILKEEGKGRCRACGSSFESKYLKPVGHSHYCIRCCEKRKVINRNWHNKCRKEVPGFREWENDMRRWHYWNVYKIRYNKVRDVQWAHEILKKKKINRDGFWHTLNHALFKDLGVRSAYWLSFTDSVIRQMKKGTLALDRKGRVMEKSQYSDSYTQDEEWIARNSTDD